MRPFNHIGIFAKPNDANILDTLLSLYEYLHNENYRIKLDENSGRLLHLPYLSDAVIAQEIDVGIVVGGDGTLLSAGRLLSTYQIPVIGINLGHLGFLVDITPQKMLAQLELVLSGEYYAEERSLLYAEAYHDDQLLGSGKALNDVVLHARTQVRMIEFTTYINGKFVNTQHADGLVIATPTGSTAYALSGGGPILHPGLEAITLVPVCPHTLTQRPLVVGLDSKIEIQMCGTRTINSRLSFDGHQDIDLVSGDYVLIQQSPDKMRLLHPQSYDYYHILRTKLHWGI